MNRSKSRAAVAIVALLLGTGTTRAEEAPPPLKADDSFFPFVLPWDDASPGVSNVSNLVPAPAGKDGPIHVRDGHLYEGDERIRFLGVNFCFGANFPTHDAADKVAARMAKFGINCVRFHHMDTSISPDGLLKPDRKTIDPERLERLDYLIAALKKRGIYANINLHVGRKYPDVPDWPDAPSFFKGVDNFDPAMIRAQKDYARALLHHVNPYTKTRYADEPAVAIVEINNENALFNEWSGGGLESMPDPYSAFLQRRWNDFLKARYETDAAMRAAWSVQDVPRGAELLKNGSFDRRGEGWSFEQHSGKARQDFADGRLKLVVEEPAEQAWHIQFNQPGIRFQADTPYTLRLRARANKPVRVTINAMQAHEPWNQLWNVQQDLGPEWRDVELTFRVAEADANGRISISNLGSSKLTLEVDDVSLVPGGVMGLKPGEALGSIPWFRHHDFGVRTPEAQSDWVRFLWGLEDEYWSGIHQFVKKDLGVKCVVLGTQMGWSPAPVQAKLDAIDSHAYWQHPHFPRRPWDQDDWTIQNVPMTGRPDGGTLPRLGLSRIVGKPFLCTEYNHSAPNTYSSETALLIAAYAARQDWDGIFLFAYSHRRDDWDTKRITSFFDIDQHPAKMATLPAAAAMFLRGDVPTASQTAVAHPKPDDWIEAGRLRSAWGLGGAAFGLTNEQALTHYVGVALDGSDVPSKAPDQRDAGAFVWSAGDLRVTIDTPRTKAYLGAATIPGFLPPTDLTPPIGDRAPGVRAPLGDVTIGPIASRQGWAAITLTALDGPDLHSPGRILLTATGDVGNVGMKWRDAAKTTIGRDWGEGPSLVEGVDAVLALSVPAARVKAWPLDERGRRRADEPLKVEGDRTHAKIMITSASKTPWYEIEIAR